MPYDSNGNASLVPSYFVQDGDDVLPVQHNPPLEDIAAMLSMALIRDGRAPMSGNLNLGGNKVINLAEPTNPNDAARLADIPTGLQTSEIVYEATSTTLASSSSIDITDIDPKYRGFEAEAEFTNITTNPGVTNFQCSIGDGSTWSLFNAPLVRWSNGGTTVRRFFASIQNLDDAALSVFMRSQTENEVDPFFSFITPATYSSRPISALRFRIVPPSGSTTLLIARFRVRGILK